MKTRFLQNFGGKYAAACEEERRESASSLLQNLGLRVITNESAQEEGYGLMRVIGLGPSLVSSSGVYLKIVV
jgi:ABC-type branched-subunit amino acid transport system ATPase component